MIKYYLSVFMPIFISCSQSDQKVGETSFSITTSLTDEEDEVETDIETLLNELHNFDDTKRYAPRDFSRIALEIMNNTSISENEKITQLLKYAETHRSASAIIFGMLTGRRCQQLGPWLLKHGKKLTTEEWDWISGVLVGQYLEKKAWKDPLLILALTKYGLSSKNVDTRREAIKGLAYIGNLGDILKLLPLLNVETDLTIRYKIYKAQTRFNHPKSNNTIKHLLLEYKEPLLIEDVIDGDLVDTNRYDFIPDLKQLRAKLIKINDVTQKAQAQEIIEIIDKTIPKLERIKASGVPVGEPQEKDSESQKSTQKSPIPNNATDTNHPLEH